MFGLGVSTRRRIAALGSVAAIAAGAVLAAGGSPPASATSSPTVGLPPIKHVWIIVEENKDGAEWELLGKRYAPYLATTLVDDGALVKNYYGTGHSSADNYISMISGQPPTYDSKDDCPSLTELPGTLDAEGVVDADVSGCVYPPDVKTIADELAANGMTWKAYQEGIPAPCSMAASNGEYERKHNPFVFFDSLQSDGQCAANDVGLDQLGPDLATATSTPTYSFITPNECDDGHSDCLDPSSEGLQSETDELQQTNSFLQTWVPRIMASPAYADGGLIAIVWDESDTDLTACCGEVEDDPDGSTAGGEDAGSTAGSQIVSGAGGGITGAVLLSPYIKPGTITATDYNHYAFLKTLEDMWNLPTLGYANTPGLQPMGSDVFTNWNGMAAPSGTTTTTATSTTPTVNPDLARCASAAPRVGAVHVRRYGERVFLSGTTSEARCAAKPALSQIAAVQVAMARHDGRLCQWASGAGFAPASSCADPIIHAAHGGRSWQLTLELTTPPGHYLVLVRAEDGHAALSPWRRVALTER